MDILRLPSISRLATLSLLLARTFAQANTNATDPNSDPCRVDFDPDAPVNATGSLNIHWNALMMDPTQNDWTFTLTYNETRDSNGTVHRWESYISVPDASEANLCTFMLAGLNRTSSSTQRNGCDGVIDDACTSVLREIINVGGESQCSWPTPAMEFTDRLRQACGAEILDTSMRTYRQYIQRPRPINPKIIMTMRTVPVKFANSTEDTRCSHASPPGSTSPENYRTFSTAELAWDRVNVNSDRNTSDFTWYDTYVRQTVPIVVAAEFLGGIAETQVLCVAPKEFAEGSRVPVRKSAASEKRLPTSWMSVGTVFIISVVIILA